MDRELSVTPILLNHQPKPGANAWAKLLIYEPTESELLATRGKMFAVITLASKADIDFTPLMGMIIETLHQRYFGASDGGILPTLEATLDAIHKQLLLAGQQDKRLSAGFSFDVLTAVSWGTVLYLGQLGSSRAFLLRQGKLFDIGDKNRQGTSVYLSSGVLQAGDKFLLATGAMLEKFSEKQIQHHLSLGNDTMAQSLEQQLDPSPGSLQSAIILVVDIKQVPSAEDEALNIVDSDAIAPGRRSRRALSADRLKQPLEKMENVGANLWGWRLAGRIPGLPIVIIVACLIVIALSLFGGRLWGDKHSSININPALMQLQDMMNQAKQTADINPDRSSDILDEMAPILANAKKVSQDKRIAELERQMTLLQNKLLNIQVLTPHPLTAIPGSTPQPKLAIDGQRIYVLDASSHQLIVWNNNSKQSIFSQDDLDRSSRFVVTDGGPVIATGSKLSAIDGSGKVSSTLRLDGVPLSLASYQQNAYALMADGQLLRIPGQDRRLKTPSKYFTAPISRQGLVDVAIDGSVYALWDSGKVAKYLSGELQKLTLERSELAQGARAIFTDESADSLYILTDHALLAWSKVGQYLGQYRLTDTKRWDAAAVDAAHKTLYILTDGKLVEAELPEE